MLAIVAVFIAYHQLKKLNKQKDIGIVMAVLETEREMNVAKKELDESALSIRKRNQVAPGMSEEETEIYKDQINIGIENLLNSIDRLAFLILKGYIPEEIWKREYRELIANTVREYEDKLGAGTYWHNIVDLHNKLIRE